MYPALLPLMHTHQLQVVDCTDAPADLNGLVRFAERRSLVSARVPSRFKRSILPVWACALVDWVFHPDYDFVGFSLSTYCYFDLIVDNPDHGYFVVFRRAIACYEYDHNQLNESTRSRICVRIDTERSRNNGTGTVTRRGGGGAGPSGVGIAAGAWDFPVLLFKPVLEPILLYFEWISAFFLEIKVAGE